ncbi:hypothetical protein EOPP23_07475 [Endozoicomonas sp. OPT23]|nr:hypothetical protein [Endozoicomonas sp. OPT23]
MQLFKNIANQLTTFITAMLLNVLCLALPCQALELSTFNISSGINYSNMPFKAKVLYPRNQFHSDIHLSKENPDFVAEELVYGWILLRNQLNTVQVNILSNQQIDPLSIDFIYHLNSILSPETYSRQADSRKEWEEGSGSLYTTTFPFMLVDLNTITSPEIEQLVELYRNLYQNPELTISYPFSMQLNASSSPLEFTLPPWVVKKVASFHQDRRRRGLSDPEEKQFHLTSVDVCFLLATLFVEDSDEIAFPYHLEFCNSCPEQPLTGSRDPVEDKVSLAYPFHFLNSSNEIIFPDLLKRYKKALYGASNDYQLIITIADYTQLFLVLHPFLDGNGRTFRFLANYVLMLYGFAPAVFDTFMAVPTTREKWREMFLEAQWKGQQLYDKL